MTTDLPEILVAGLVHHRRECPGVLGQYLAALRQLEWPADKIGYHFVANSNDVNESRDLVQEVGYCGPPGATIDRVVIPGQEDSRHIGGARWRGDTQMRLAFLRNLVFERWSRCDAEYLLLVDSDVVLAPAALEAMYLAARQHPGSTISLLIDNRVAEDHEPHPNAQERTETGGYRAAAWRTDGALVPVARSGACTLYPRQALQRRFRWDPRYREEHEGLFDDLSALGMRHFLLCRPELADHRMHRDPPLCEPSEQPTNAEEATT